MLEVERDEEVFIIKQKTNIDTLFLKEIGAKINNKNEIEQSGEGCVFVVRHLPKPRQSQ